jgi:acetyl-CoA carboxylase biotin carboxyl carrier protein
MKIPSVCVYSAFHIPHSAFEGGSSVSDESKSSSGPFDVAIVGQLVNLMREFELSEVVLQEGDKRICLRRGPKSVAMAPAAYMPPLGPSAFAQPASVPAAGAPSAPADTGSGRKLLEIKSNMVGTFYAKPDPAKEDYVKVGTRVTPESIVCKIEAMKIFNELPAGVNGVIAEVCVQNGQFVEYDQALFRVEPS